MDDIERIRDNAHKYPLEDLQATMEAQYDVIEHYCELFMQEPENRLQHEETILYADQLRSICKEEMKRRGREVMRGLIDRGHVVIDVGEL